MVNEKTPTRTARKRAEKVEPMMNGHGERRVIVPGTAGTVSGSPGTRSASRFNGKNPLTILNKAFPAFRVTEAPHRGGVSYDAVRRHGADPGLYAIVGEDNPDRLWDELEAATAAALRR